MVRPLTDRSQIDVTQARTSGPGTNICRKCGGPKETSRRGSQRCKGCDTKPVRSARLIQVRLDEATFDALLDEATRHDQTAEERVAFLLTRKYTPKP